MEPSYFELREDGTIATPGSRPQSGHSDSQTSAPRLILRHESPDLYLYQGNCLELLDVIAAKHPEGRFDAIFADPPYFLSNGGITCHAGRMVKVDKGDWDKSRGPEVNHEFHKAWLQRCQKVLKPNGTIWVSGTNHVIFSIGYAMQQLGFKILNDIAWEKPNPPPNLSCRYFTHSTETIIWAARDAKSKHVFNYDAMRAVTGKQMKTVWREFAKANGAGHLEKEEGEFGPGNIWTIGAPTAEEKQFGKHPTQKPIALIERCLLASTNPGDLVLDPFIGGGTTAIAAIRLKRGCVGIEAHRDYTELAARRCGHEIGSIWRFLVTTSVTVFGAAMPFENLVSTPALVLARPAWSNAPQKPMKSVTVLSNSPGQKVSQIDLDLFPDPINGSRVDDKRQSQIPTERIFHETKFVFLSCTALETTAVVHAAVDASLQEAWAKAPTCKRQETTHIVRCETEILRIKS
ncbi:MAG: DNA-methyltransferase [Limisphaerales bacterium]